MNKRILLLALMTSLLAACASPETRTRIAGAVGAIGLASDTMISPEWMSAALVTYALYDPKAPNWKIDVVPLDETRARLDLRFRSLATGGEGEARVVFRRNARRLSDEGGFAGYEVLSYEEGVESTRPFAQRYASGEIRLLHVPAVSMRTN